MGLESDFQAAWSAFVDDTSFWVSGHGFDTILDCLNLCNPTLPPGVTMQDIAATALFKLGMSVQPPTPSPAILTGEDWYDDDGWWVVAAAKAYSLCDKFGWQAYKSTWQEFCLSRWERFSANAPNVFAMVTEKYGDRFQLLSPAVPGGVWNTQWLYDSLNTYYDPSTCAPTPADRNVAVNLGGFQNSVTNTLYLESAQRLALIAAADPNFFDSPQEFTDAATSEFTFLETWVGYGQDDVPQGMLNRLSSGGAVLRERVGAYEYPPGAYGQVCGYDPALAWAGDNGIYLGGLVDKITLDGDSDGTLLQRAKDIITGTLSYLGDGNGVLLSWPLGQGAPGNFDEAYATGFGAFLRYLTYAYLNNAALAQYIRNTTITFGSTTVTYQALVTRMVGALGKSTAYADQCTYGSDMTLTTNVLALDVAAAVMAGS